MHECYIVSFKSSPQIKHYLSVKHPIPSDGGSLYSFHFHPCETLRIISNYPTLEKVLVKIDNSLENHKEILETIIKIFNEVLE